MRIGIDLGGTKTEAIALEDDGKVAARQRIVSPRDDYAATLEAVGGLVEAIEQEVGRKGRVGVGIPGAVSLVHGRVKNANSTWLIGRPLREDLERRLARPVRLANDANCFALSEAKDGAGMGASVVFGVIVGTGTGGGLVVEGKVVSGANGIAGEWGHNPLPWPRPEEWPGPPCYCGRTGCIETFLSGPGLAVAHRALTGQELDASAISARAEAGDPEAEGTLALYADRMARGLAMVMNVVDPNVIVLGGGLSQIASLYTRVPAAWARYVFSDRIDTRLLPPAHGDASGVRGAAWLWGPGE